MLKLVAHYSSKSHNSTKMKTKTLSKIILGSSILGVLNGGYLTYLFIKLTYFTGAGASFCDFNNRFTCSNVVTSKYAQLFGLPVCTYAVVVYLIMVLLAIRTMKTKNPKNSFYAISVLAGMGMMMNVIYTYNEYAFLSAVCTLCLGCLVLITVNLAASIKGYSKS
jgi:uncharacterized membrane protein